MFDGDDELFFCLWLHYQVKKFATIYDKSVSKYVYNVVTAESESGYLTLFNIIYIFIPNNNLKKSPIGSDPAT